MENSEDIMKIIKDVLKRKTNPDIIYSEYVYMTELSRENYYIDLLLQVGSTLHIFECKTKSKEKKARKQLAFHKFALESNKLHFYWIGKLLPYSQIKTYYISEEQNIIINIETGDSEVLNPTFLENPMLFLNK